MRPDLGPAVNVLLVGGGQGSWTMRGLQLGQAIGGRPTTTPTRADWDWADLVVLVKRHGARFAGEARATGKPVVWDAVDCWAQPSQNGYSDRQALDLLAGQVKAIRPALAVGATGAQAAAFASLGVPSVCLPHHSWDGLEPAPPADDVRAVAYQGNPAYLGRWEPALRGLCEARGWRLLVNPPDLRAADIVVALRDGIWDGWMPREWKSGVKVANALAAGRPVLTQSTAAYSEIRSPGDVVESEGQLRDALDAWTPHGRRAEAYERARGMAQAYTLSTVADAYRRILDAARQGSLPCAS